MTDDPTSDSAAEQADPGTALASAYLDGEVDEAEVVRVESDPALLARVAELEALRDRLAVPAPPPDLVDDHVGAALAAFGPSTSTTATAGTDTVTPATDLASHRARRDRRWYERIPLGVVAAAVVVIALVGAISQIDTGDSDDMAADTAGEALESTDDAGDAAGSGGDDSAADGDAGDESPAPESGSDTFAADEPTSAEAARLAFSDVDTLADHLAARFDAADDGPAPTTSTTSTQSDAAAGQTPAGCALDALPDVDQRSIVAIEPAVVAGDEVTVLVITGDVRRLVVVDDATCDVIDDRAF